MIQNARQSMGDSNCFNPFLNELYHYYTWLGADVLVKSRPFISLPVVLLFIFLDFFFFSFFFSVSTFFHDTVAMTVENRTWTRLFLLSLLVPIHSYRIWIRSILTALKKLIIIKLIIFNGKTLIDWYLVTSSLSMLMYRFCINRVVDSGKIIAYVSCLSDSGVKTI